MRRNITGIGENGELFVAGSGWMVESLGGWVGGAKAAAELPHSKLADLKIGHYTRGTAKGDAYKSKRKARKSGAGAGRCAEQCDTIQCSVVERKPT